MNSKSRLFKFIHFSKFSSTYYSKTRFSQFVALTSSEHGTVKSSSKLKIPAKEKKKAEKRVEKQRLHSLRKKSSESKSCESTTGLSGSEDSRDLDEGSMVVEDSSSSVYADRESNASS